MVSVTRKSFNLFHSLTAKVVIDRWKQALNSPNFSSSTANSISGQSFPLSTLPTMVTYSYDATSNRMRERSSKSTSKSNNSSYGLQRSNGHEKINIPFVVTSNVASIGLNLKYIQVFFIISFFVIWT